MALNEQFLKTHFSAISSVKQSWLYFPGQVFSEKTIRWSTSAPRLPQKELEQEEEEVSGRKVRRWRLNRLQEEGSEDYSSISLLLSEIKEGLRINWIPQLRQFPQRSSIDLKYVRLSLQWTEVHSHNPAGCCQSLSAHPLLQGFEPATFHSAPHSPRLCSLKHKVIEQARSRYSALPELPVAFFRSRPLELDRSFILFLLSLNQMKTRQPIVIFFSTNTKHEQSWSLG